MTNEELYLSISELISCNSKELEHRMDVMEGRLSNRIECLDTKIDMVEAKLSNRINDVEAKLSNRISDVETTLRHQIHSINLQLENDIGPRIQNIEMCYVTTFERYKDNTEKFERMQLDIDVLKSVVRKHDETICATSA